MILYDFSKIVFIVLYNFQKISKNFQSLFFNDSALFISFLFNILPETLKIILTH